MYEHLLHSGLFWAGKFKVTQNCTICTTLGKIKVSVTASLMSWLVIQDELFSYGLLPLRGWEDSVPHWQTVLKSYWDTGSCCEILCFWESVVLSHAVVGKELGVEGDGGGGGWVAVNVKWNGVSCINQSRRKCLPLLSCLCVHNSPHILQLSEWT